MRGWKGKGDERMGTKRTSAVTGGVVITGSVVTGAVTGVNLGTIGGSGPGEARDYLDAYLRAQGGSLTAAERAALEAFRLWLERQ